MKTKSMPSRDSRRRRPSRRSSRRRASRKRARRSPRRSGRRYRASNAKSLEYAFQHMHELTEMSEATSTPAGYPAGENENVHVTKKEEAGIGNRHRIVISMQNTFGENAPREDELDDAINEYNTNPVGPKQGHLFQSLFEKIKTASNMNTFYFSTRPDILYMFDARGRLMRPQDSESSSSRKRPRDDSSSTSQTAEARPEA